jgi:hypothetical protein
MNCPNCGSAITCGCQRRTASDGTVCCANCITTYENKNKVGKKKDDQSLTPQQVITLKK